MNQTNQKLAYTRDVSLNRAAESNDVISAILFERRGGAASLTLLQRTDVILSLVAIQNNSTFTVKSGTSGEPG
jgi:hypothetical protein